MTAVQIKKTRLGKCLKLFVSTEGPSSDELASHFDLATPKCLLTEPSRDFTWLASQFECGLHIDSATK